MGFWIMFLDGCSFIHRIKVIKSIRGREAFMCIEYNETTLVVEFEILIHSANIYSIPALCQARWQCVGIYQ